MSVTATSGEYYDQTTLAQGIGLASLNPLVQGITFSPFITAEIDRVINIESSGGLTFSAGKHSLCTEFSGIRPNIF